MTAVQVAIYLISIACMSILMGLLLNQIYLHLGVNAMASIGIATEVVPDIIKIMGSVILAGLMMYSIGRGEIQG